MVHGPCGPGGRTDLPCWNARGLKCDKFYPKPESPVTFVDDRGFVHFRRDWNNKATYQSGARTVVVHDGWVVPYNAALLLKYECHANLEIASTRRVVKYLFKYLCKGTSLQNVRVVPLHLQEDEVEEYATRRVIGASDACWRLLDYDLTVCEPTVEMLPVHLEGEESVMFRPGQEQEAVDSSTSRLLLYFQRPAGDVFDALTYQSFYENFIIHSRFPANSRVAVYAHADGVHYVTARQRLEKVTRLFWVGPNRGELYYLRLLLSSVPCRGFADLLTKAGGVEGCDTFQEVARELGLVDNHREYAEALEEASTFMTGASLRSFFVLLCNVGAPAALLWEDAKAKLSEDHLERHPDDPEKAYKLALLDIDRGLRRNGSRLADHGLPYVHDDTTELGRELLAHSEGAERDFVEQWLPRLHEDQRAVYDHVRLLSQQSPAASGTRSLFLEAPGGYGKTAVLKVIASDLRSQGKVVLCVATSGIAALNMERGTTAHSMFRLPLDLKGGLATWGITNGTQRAELIRAASLIIFDEAPMMHKYVLELLDRSLRDLMRNNLPFGGKILLLSGDFQQTPPVVEGARCPSDVLDASIKSSPLWDGMKRFALTTPQRTRSDPDYSRFLLDIGQGEAPEVVFDEGDGKQTRRVALPGVRGLVAVSTLIDTVYPPDVVNNPDQCAKRAILAPLNANVREINDIVIDMIEGEVTEVRSFDSVDQEGDDGLDVDVELLNMSTSKGVPPHCLKLKVGAVCLIMRNLNVTQGLVNGTKVIVQAVSRYLVRARKADSEESFAIPRIIFKYPMLPGSPLTVARRQFPLQLAYAMSVHKSQGQTIDLVGLDLRTEVFTHGQLYTALSRVRSRECLWVCGPPERSKDGIVHTVNIVYKELLL
ncbi:hypothetical protein ONE63_011529 [Megalurothrips usitatus]|uniref:ATP-dependent DNA helicase n=1 Tax=Megalurothrips usitatus TaxID=439358 RepID=A0AAV7WZ25_9NEOP|nr:hypothetical protein ONE63_011529 [Megalurothrips usitatus]